MNSKTVASSAGDGDKPFCLACGSSLPTPVSSGQSETIEVIPERAGAPKLEELSTTRSQAPLAEPEKLDEKPSAPAQSEWNKKSDIEIRLNLGDLVRGRPKHALEKITNENQEEASVGSMLQPNDSKDQTDSVSECNEKTHLKSDVDSSSLNVIEISERRKIDESELNILQFLGNNWRQFTAVLPGLFLLLTLGAHYVYTIFDMFDTYNYYHDESPHRYYYWYDFYPYRDDIIQRPPKDDLELFLVTVMWFVGVIVGNVIGAVFIRNLKKRTIYYLAAILQIIAGFLFCLLRYQQFDDRLPIVPVTYRSLMLTEFTLGVGARLVSGIVSGLVYLTVTVHASDIASKRMRRMISYTIVMIIAFSTLIYSSTHRYWYLPSAKLPSRLFSFDIDMIALGLIVLILNRLFTHETVPYYLTRGKVSKAQKKFVELSGERSGEPSSETLEKFDELQLMVQGDQENVQNIFDGENLKPLFTVLCARLLRLFIMNTCAMMIMMSSRDMHYPKKMSLRGFGLDDLSVMQIFFGFISLSLAACLGRHKFFYISALLMATSIFVCAFLNFSSLQRFILLATFALLSLVLDCYQQVQSLEAFTVTKKASSLAMIACFEHTMHAVLIAGHIITSYNERTTLMFIVVAIIVLSIALLLAIVPETGKLSLRETRNKFNKVMASAV